MFWEAENWFDLSHDTVECWVPVNVEVNNEVP